MSNVGFQARPLSVESIRSTATKVRDILGYQDVACIPVEHLLKFALPRALDNFVYDVVPVSEMGDNEGLVAFDTFEDAERHALDMAAHYERDEDHPGCADFITVTGAVLCIEPRDRFAA